MDPDPTPHCPGVALSGTSVAPQMFGDDEPQGADTGRPVWFMYKSH